jgi:hypothetical protein
MRYIKICSIFTILLLVTGCYASYTKKLDVPIARNVPKPRTVSLLDVLYSGDQSVSIGALLFRLARYRVGEYEAIRLKPPIELVPFPENASWFGTHIYNDQNSGDLIVFTTQAYYNGQIGVILDKQGKVTTREPLVQLDGAKKGRTWRLNGDGQFFEESRVLVGNRWAIRYGGKVGDQYIFEIVNVPESSTSEILQSIKISESSFFEGFTVREVFIKGLSGDKQGVIKYSVEDKLSDNR